MTYQVFARKFRPQIFEEVIGQEPITTTLKNAIHQGRIPQSFLFAGPRGIGKTSTARILAKSLNCAKGPTEKPCGQCGMCTEITQSNSLDVLEIDGASNRGIDEIRNLRETVKFKPTHSRFKIYIIDEVHMLTQEAFNALLKTLEEPPEHVKFIFATTEPHKVPLTILSRCQRFNFKRITTSEIAKKLEAIAAEEGLRWEKNALDLIARTSEGALRDAESLLDQLATFSRDKIKEEDVLFTLGLASEEAYFSMLSALRAKEAQKIFVLVQEIYENGVDLVQFAKGLLEMFRHLLIFQCAENAETFVDMSERAVEEFKKRKNDFSRGELLLALNILQNLQTQLRRNLASPKLLVETALLKLFHLDGFKWVEEIASQNPNLPRDPAPEHRSPNGESGIKKGISQTQNPGLHTKKSDPQALSDQTHIPPQESEPTHGRREESVSQDVRMTLEEIQALWPRIVDFVKSKRMSTGIFLSEAAPVEIRDSIVTLGLPSEFQFHKETLEKENNRRLVEEAFEVVSGRKIRVQFVIMRAAQEETAGSKTASQDETAKLQGIISEALNIFEGAKVIRKE
jgi:DNA polymerase-3 subunit gamma/tau